MSHTVRQGHMLLLDWIPGCIRSMRTTLRTTFPQGAWKTVQLPPRARARAALRVVPRGHFLGSPRNLAMTTHSPASSPGCAALRWVSGSEVTRMTRPAGDQEPDAETASELHGTPGPTPLKTRPSDPDPARRPWRPLGAGSSLPGANVSRCSSRSRKAAPRSRQPARTQVAQEAAVCGTGLHATGSPRPGSAAPPLAPPAGRGQSASPRVQERRPRALGVVVPGPAGAAPPAQSLRQAADTCVWLRARRWCLLGKRVHVQNILVQTVPCVHVQRVSVCKTCPYVPLQNTCPGAKYVHMQNVPVCTCAQRFRVSVQNVSKCRTSVRVQNISTCPSIHGQNQRPCAKYVCACKLRPCVHVQNMSCVRV